MLVNVEIDVDRVEGMNCSRTAIAEALRELLEGDSLYVDFADDGDQSEYTIDNVGEAELPSQHEVRAMRSVLRKALYERNEARNDLREARVHLRNMWPTVNGEIDNVSEVA
jgi:hypothetical protein